MPLNHTPQDTFTDDIDIHNTSDFVIGGTNGESNRPIKDLINNTFYLFNRLARFEDIKENVGSYVYNVADARKAFVFTLSANAAFTLPDTTTVPPGTVIPIIADIDVIKCLKVQAAGSDFIRNGSAYNSAMYLHDGESLVLIAGVGYWSIMSAHGNFDKVGDDFISRAIRKNSFVRNGQTLNRQDNARLFEFVKNYLSDGIEVVSDSTWLSNAVRYRSLFSWGDGDATNGTTFRLPDDRGLFERNLDLGRGLDIGRQDERAGGYELDELKQHNHTYNRPRTDTVGSQYEGNRMDNGSGRGLWTGDSVNTGMAGGGETRPKNTGKIPLIYY